MNGVWSLRVLMFKNIKLKSRGLYRGSTIDLRQNYEKCLFIRNRFMKKNYSLHVQHWEQEWHFRLLTYCNTNKKILK